MITWDALVTKLGSSARDTAYILFYSRELYESKEGRCEGKDENMTLDAGLLEAMNKENEHYINHNLVRNHSGESHRQYVRLFIKAASAATSSKGSSSS
mmetsp:Transcript_22631/g.36469  ORF Transcript_22631/g.36469 Transcript_22631/m.36469 type:complete len:98 (+) Transcript_22631:142-435(+)